ncbi:RNA-directed DNA polymerase, eukaryota [Tanacetum coccineum]
MSDSFTSSFRRVIRGGIESTQLSDIMSILGSLILSSNEDRYFWDLNGDGDFRVKDVRNLIDETFLPKDVSPTRWVKSIPIKVNIFAWKVPLDRLLTRFNLVSRGVPVPSLSCPSCNIVQVIETLQPSLENPILGQKTQKIFFLVHVDHHYLWILCYRI